MGQTPGVSSLSLAPLAFAKTLLAFPCTGHEDEEFGFELDPRRIWVTIPADPTEVAPVEPTRP